MSRRIAVVCLSLELAQQGKSAAAAVADGRGERRTCRSEKLAAARRSRYLSAPSDALSDDAAFAHAGGAPLSGSQRLELVPVTGPDRPLLEQLVRAYYLKDGHAFREDRQPAALAALVAGEPLCRAWLIRLDARPVGYVVLALTFSVEAGGREACVDEFYLVPEIRNQGLGRRALALVEAEARDLAVRRIFLEVQRGNRVIGLYRRAGYVDHDRFLMSKFLMR